MAKSYDFQWQVPIPEALREGAIFDRYDEVGIICRLKRDRVMWSVTTKFEYI